VNRVPVSEIKTRGTPNLHTMFFHMKFITFMAVIEATSSASIHLVEYSTATIKNFICLATKGNGLSISMPHV